jgi:hypothetical protein
LGVKLPHRFTNGIIPLYKTPRLKAKNKRLLKNSLEGFSYLLFPGITTRGSFLYSENKLGIKVDKRRNTRGESGVSKRNWEESEKRNGYHQFRTPIDISQYYFQTIFTNKIKL